MNKKIKIVILVFFLTIFSLNFSIVEAGSKKIGDKCINNSECRTNDCQNGFCACDSASDCGVEYDGSSWTCESPNQYSFDLNFCKKTDGTLKYPLENGLAIGEICFSNENCISEDCEGSNKKSTLENDPWYGATLRSDISYCDCDDNNDCAVAYGTGGNWKCVDGANTSYDIDYCRNDSTGEVKLPFDGNNESGFWGNLTDMVLDPEAFTKTFGDALEKDFKAPQPKINIPGLSFSEVDPREITSIDADGNAYIKIPFLGEYISQIYRYLLTFGTIVAVIMIIFSGLQWILSAGNSDVISTQKKRILGVLIGLILLFSSYTILYIINPYLVNFNDLKILYIKQELFSVQEESDNTDFTELQNLTDKIKKPDWTYQSFDCNKWTSKRVNAYQPAGVLPSQYTKTYTCNDIKDPTKGILLPITTIPEMQEWVCKAGANAVKQGYQLVITSSYRSFESQADLWCGEGLKKYPDPAIRKKYYAVPGNSIHGLGQAIDVFLYDKNGTRLTFFGGAAQCNSSAENIKTLANIFYNVSENFYRLETEIWHFEYSEKPVNELRDKHTGYPKSCNK